VPRGSFDRSGRRAQTRARLLDAAARVYARRGFDTATIDEIAHEAGFTKGAVYDHFGSKEGLLFALLDEHLAAQIAEQVALFDPSAETAERPRAGADRWIEELDQDPDAFRLFVEAWLRGQRDEGLRPRVAAGLEAWRSTMRGLGRQHGGEIDEELLDGVANVMLALGAGIGMVRLTDPDRVSPRLLGAVYALVLRALETSEEARRLLADAIPARPAAPTR